MKKESTTFGLSHEKLARLWGVGDEAWADRAKPTQDQRKAEALRDQLAEALPLDPAVSVVLPEALSLVLEQFHPLADCSVGSLLLDSSADPTVVGQIKDRYRQKAESSACEAERQAATAIYYAAIAHALLFQEKAWFRENRITTFSYQELEAYFLQLHGLGWLTPELVRLFERAHVVCREKGKTPSP
jgi:hypothetical protein